MKKIIKEALMKRKKTNGMIARWKDALSKGKAEKSDAENQKKKSGPQTGGASLSMIKNIPVTFRLSRLENPKEFELMSFVIKACSKTDDKPFRTVLHVEQSRTGCRLVACDGHRLHIAEISKKIKSGDYKPYVTKDTIILGGPVTGIKFPAWSKAVPEKSQKLGVINLEKSGLGKDRNETEKLTIALQAFNKQTGETVNLRFLEDLTKREWAVYKQNSGQQGIILRQKTGRFGEPDGKSPTAVIMPIAKAA
jgi:hypothetical protein